MTLTLNLNIRVFLNEYKIDVTEYEVSRLSYFFDFVCSLQVKRQQQRQRQHQQRQGQKRHTTLKKVKIPYGDARPPAKKKNQSTSKSFFYLFFYHYYCFVIYHGLTFLTLSFIFECDIRMYYRIKSVLFSS